MTYIVQAVKRDLQKVKM